ncbi:phage tail protein [Flammeovirga kamogawensis]|uniref:Phage tail protein n=1 Tax=Flammeovirga kamogawensis TaxID=373891 RepID=A0ABX8GSQ0_9BACT|nr:phage tail protein [Flammeovirga kamogawensis]MBB6463687.1 microcystin-dependent protein [Flammeovirga kamogawensis]QWG06187.1 phage tail protein [Flammeovirga kamogawensis]TRX68018.1 tail fiber protein [Flammeovirga kamogawensis]
MKILSLKIVSLFFICTLFVSSFSLAQNGFVVQGVARNNGHAALGDRLIPFTFQIKSNDGSTTYYSETKSIRTDTYGVFSHIVGQGDNQSGNLKNAPYTLGNLKLIVSLDDNGNQQIISDKPMNYVPYAYRAANGLPAGSIIPFVGSAAPSGWMLCDGSSIPSGTTLKDVLGMNNAPDLRGMFVRGSGTNETFTNSNSEYPQGPALNDVEKDKIGPHSHSDDISVSVNSGGSHSHSYSKVESASSYGILNYIAGLGAHISTESTNTSSAGAHEHTATVSGSINSVNGVGTGNEVRPVSYGVAYIIKL